MCMHVCTCSTSIQWDWIICLWTSFHSIPRWPAVQLFTLCELTHFRLIWYSALQKANLIHMTYGTQANFNVWDQMYLPKSEAVKSPVPYGLYLFEWYQHCPSKLSLWKDSVYMHTVSVPCQIISAFISPTSWISASQTWCWWFQAIPLLAAYVRPKTTEESWLLATCTNESLVVLETESIGGKHKCTEHCCCHQFP